MFHRRAFERRATIIGFGLIGGSIGKALGVDERLVDAFARDHFWFDREILTGRLMEVARTIGVEVRRFARTRTFGLTLFTPGRLRSFEVASLTPTSSLFGRKSCAVTRRR